MSTYQPGSPGGGPGRVNASVAVPTMQQGPPQDPDMQPSPDPPNPFAKGVTDDSEVAPPTASGPFNPGDPEGAPWDPPPLSPSPGPGPENPLPGPLSDDGEPSGEGSTITTTLPDDDEKKRTYNPVVAAIETALSSLGDAEDAIADFFSSAANDVEGYFASGGPPTHEYLGVAPAGMDTFYSGGINPETSVADFSRPAVLGKSGDESDHRAAYESHVESKPLTTSLPESVQGLANVATGLEIGLNWAGGFVDLPGIQHQYFSSDSLESRSLLDTQTIQIFLETYYNESIWAGEYRPWTQKRVEGGVSFLEGITLGHVEVSVIPDTEFGTLTIQVENVSSWDSFLGHSREMKDLTRVATDFPFGSTPAFPDDSSGGVDSQVRALPYALPGGNVAQTFEIVVPMDYLPAFDKRVRDGE